MQRKVLAYLLTTPFWSVMSTLLHLVGLRPQVYYTLTNLRGGEGQVPLAPLNTPMQVAESPLNGKKAPHKK